MANLTTTTLAAVLPTANKQRFINFLNRRPGDRGAYRTTFLGHEIEDERDGLTHIVVNLECDWSVFRSLHEPGSDSDEVMSIEQICQECDVIRMSIWSEVDDLFEYVNYDKGKPIDYKQADRPRQPNDIFIDEEDFDEIKRT